MNRIITRKLLALLLILLPSAAYSQNDTEQWMHLFNGKDLSNWIPKFTGYELGVNYRDTFQAEDGVFKVSYDNWPDFDGEFGHIFYDESFSHYRLLVEYRFVGDQVNNGPGWAFRNNGCHVARPISRVHDPGPRVFLPRSKYSYSAATAPMSEQLQMSAHQARTMLKKVN